MHEESDKPLTNNKQIDDLCAAEKAEGKTIDDLGSLVLDGEYEVAIEVIKQTATRIKFDVKSKAARKRGLERLRNHLSNVQADARANNEANGLRQEFRTAWKVVFDNGR